MDDRVVEVSKYIAVPLTQGQYAIIDIDDYERVSQYKWHAQYDKGIKSYYARRVIKKNNDTITLNMSNFILKYKNENGNSIDHKNRDSLDNTRENLAVRTRGQQMINRRKRKHSKRQDLPPGITFREDGNRYRVILTAGGNKIHKSFVVKKGEDIKQAEERAIMFREKMILELPIYRVALNVKPITLSDLLHCHNDK